MSTRANIIFKDNESTLYFYRHSDGYPECCGRELKKFVKNYTKDKYRLNIGQSAGHLIVQGYKEYKKEDSKMKAYYKKLGRPNYSMNAWKVGVYEPTYCIHGDIEYLYTIDLIKRELTCKDVYSNKIVEVTKF